MHYTEKIPAISQQGLGLNEVSHSEELFNAIQIAVPGTQKDSLST